MTDDRILPFAFPAIRGRKLLAAFDDATMRSAVTDVLAREDVETIFVFSSQMAQYLPVEPRARSPSPQPLEHHARHRRRGRRQQYVSHEFLCHVRPLVSAREMTRRHRRWASEPDIH